MKKTVITIILFILTIITIITFMINLLVSDYTFNRIMVKNDYYQKSLNNVKSKLKLEINDDNMKKIIDQIIDENIIKYDIELLKNNQENIVKENLKNKFRLLFSSGDYDQSSIDYLTNNLINVYLSNIFMYKEYISVIDMLPIVLSGYIPFIISFIILLIFILMIKKNYYISILYSNYFVSFCLLFIFLFFRIGKIFDGVNYINYYYSLYVEDMVFTLLELTGLIGLLVFVINILIQNIFTKKN